MQRFRDRLRALLARKLWLGFGNRQTEVPPPPAPSPPVQVQEPTALAAPPGEVRTELEIPGTMSPVDVVAGQPSAERTEPRAIVGSARSSDGATSPWLLLPPERAYRLYVPSVTVDSAPLPLVVMIHGCKETAEEFERGTRMNGIADRAGFAVLYPDQASFANLRRCWNWFERNTAAGKGECAIVLEMIHAANQHVALDRARICVAGMSSGGALAALLAYHHPDVFAAAAVHSGLPPMMPPSAAAAISAMEKGVRVDPEALADRYWNTHEVLPPPLIIVHGNEDARVTERNATGLMRVWERLFEAAPQATPLVREARVFPATDTLRAYSQIDLQREGRIVVRSLRVHGLAHNWSGGDATLPFNDENGPDASTAIWKFFERQQR